MGLVNVYRPASLTQFAGGANLLARRTSLFSRGALTASAGFVVMVFNVMMFPLAREAAYLAHRFGRLSHGCLQLGWCDIDSLMIAGYFMGFSRHRFDGSRWLHIVEPSL